MDPKMAWFKPYSARVRAAFLAAAVASSAATLAALSQGLVGLAVLAGAPAIMAICAALTANNVEFVLFDGRLAKIGWNRRIRSEVDLSQPLQIESHETGSLRIDRRGRQAYGRKLVVRQGNSRITFTHGGPQWPRFVQAFSQALLEHGHDDAAQALEAFPTNFLEPATPKAGIVKRR